MFFIRVAGIPTLVALIGLVCGTAWSQTDLKSTSATPVAANFVLGPGDDVSIQVQDLDEFTGKTFRVDPDGGFDLPLVGRQEVKGLTVDKFRIELANRLTRYITTPHVTINLVASQSRPVSVIGEVNSPGVRQLDGSKSLIEVISLAGGLKQDAGPKIIITRQARWGALPLPGETTDPLGRFSRATLSLNDLLSAKDPASNIPMMPDDVVSVPKGDVVYVVGNVRKAGGFPLASQDSISLLQALSLAEGLAPNAASGRAKVLRPVTGSSAAPKEIPVDVGKIFSGKAPDMPLYANDILFIPGSAAKSGSRRALEAIIQAATGAAIYAR